MRVLIVEDESMAANRLIGLLKKSQFEFSLVGVCESIRATVQWLDQNLMPDLIFLDIQLSDGHSFEIFEKRKLNCPVIFTTAFDKYAIKAFQVNSVDYLLKPFQLAEIERAIEKLNRIKEDFTGQKNISESLEQLAGQFLKKYKTRFFVKSRDKAFSVIVEDIALFNYEDGAVILYRMDGKKFLIRYSLDDLQKLLDPDLFFRTSRKQICQINSIEQINTAPNGQLTFVLPVKVMSEKLVVSKHRASEFRAWLGH